MDAASPSPIDMLPYYKQMFAKSSPLTGPFGQPGPNRIHFRRHQEASPQKGGWSLGEGPGYGSSLTERLAGTVVAPSFSNDARQRRPGSALRRKAPVRLPFLGNFTERYLDTKRTAPTQMHPAR